MTSILRKVEVCRYSQPCSKANCVETKLMTFLEMKLFKVMYLLFLASNKSIDVF